MRNKDYNNEFFGWNGSIARKDYAINMLIVFALYIVLSFVNFQSFEHFIPFKILFIILVYSAELLKFVLLMCALSLVYRRIFDFAGIKPYRFQLIMKRLFVFLYVVPALYLYFIRYFFDIIPVLIMIMDTLSFFVLIPLAFIGTIVLCFIKGN